MKRTRDGETLAAILTKGSPKNKKRKKWKRSKDRRSPSPQNSDYKDRDQKRAHYKSEERSGRLKLSHTEPSDQNQSMFEHQPTPEHREKVYKHERPSKIPKMPILDPHKKERYDVYTKIESGKQYEKGSPRKKGKGRSRSTQPK